MKAKHLLFFSVVFPLLSCHPGRIFDEYTEIHDNRWNYNKPVEFKVIIDEIQTGYNISVNVRHASGYPYRNLFLFISMSDSAGHETKDTLECIIADERGEYLGSGAGDIWDINIPFKNDFRFERPGVYIFTIHHGMRVENLPLIMDIGLCIEKSVTSN
ncbi:MAG: gliding motility lipoprotein GldH [Bacteroidetes bacterium]|nr:gliding motility lipoprotein GldH [Bacteroidota bacterium]